VVIFDFLDRLFQACESRIKRGSQGAKPLDHLVNSTGR